MSSLSAHLRQAGDHGRLGFHPACPVCCEERLAGRLPADRLVSGRAPAVLAAGVIAFSYASPAAVLAQDAGQDQGLVPDSTTESAPPGAEVVAGPEDADEAAEDASGAADDALPDGTGAVEPDPVTDASDDSAEAVAAPAPAAVPAGQAPSGQPAAAAPQAKPLVGAKTPGSVAPATPAPAAPAAAAPGAAGSVAAPGGTTPSPAAAPGVVEARDGNERAPARKRVVRRLVHKHRHAPNVAVRSASTPVAPVAAAPQPAVTTVAYVAQQVPAPVVVRHAGKPARPGDRAHVVFAGESLWSIAQDVLGAKATVAEVAREVDRLWALNRERIGTGDRDLLPIGARLVLR